ncbi:MAG: biosynthetic arginine decarboxylase [Bdellovibrionota bacterium]
MENGVGAAVSGISGIAGISGVSEVSNEVQKWTKEEADSVYGHSRWGEGFFDINDKGHLVVLPNKNSKDIKIDVYEVIEEMKAQKLAFPAVIRFHDILRSQVKNLNRAFREVIEEAEYEGRYIGVYPIKVNQLREVVEEVVDAGSPYDFGLEAGSKPELLAVMALNTNQQALTILNGYKDEDYMRLALLGRQLDRSMIVVIEKTSELHTLLRLSKEMGVRPLIGIRGKMSIKGFGKWENSSGDRAKFGLTMAEIMNVVNTLKSEGLGDCLKLFHFHIGSQISNIRAVKDAVTECVRIYSELYKMGIPFEYFDVGGGLGVDYDGSNSTSLSSKNYSMTEYASDIVYGVKQVCDLAGVPHPNIVSESGRAITAHHSCVITNVIGKIDPANVSFSTRKVTGEHVLVTNMRDLDEYLTEKNMQEVWNDASKLKDDCLNAFQLGVLGLEERAKVETLYWQIAKKIYLLAKDKEQIPEIFSSLFDLISSQYLCNFSVFQSAADSWAIHQLLPVMPVHRLDERPLSSSALADITCDSDGKIDQFMGADGICKTLPLHDLKDGEDYYLGIFMTGAYQDVMGDMHNLFGRLNEVHVFADDDDPTDFYIEETIRGGSSRQVLSTMQYNPDFMAATVKRSIDGQVKRGKVTPRQGVKLVDFYEECLDSYTYLSMQYNRQNP